LPRQRPGAPPMPNDFRYRFRLVQSDKPIRTQKFGDFEVISTIHWIAEATWDDRPRTRNASAVLRVRYRGQPVTLDARSQDSTMRVRATSARGVAVIPGPQLWLWRGGNGARAPGKIGLIKPEGASLRKEYVADGGAWSPLPPITNDTVLFQQAARNLSPDGQV